VIKFGFRGCLEEVEKRHRSLLWQCLSGIENAQTWEVGFLSTYICVVFARCIV